MKVPTLFTIRQSWAESIERNQANSLVATGVAALAVAALALAKVLTDVAGEEEVETEEESVAD